MTKRQELPSLFLASSSEANDIAKYLAVLVNDFCRPKVWSLGAFVLSQTTIEALSVVAAGNYDFAAVIVTPDDMTKTRSRRYATPRDNVVFELGLFTGSLGLRRTFVVCDEKAKLPSDWNGITTARYVFPEDDDWSGALLEASIKIKEAIALAQPRERPEDSPALRTEIERLQRELDGARAQIAVLRRSAEIHREPKLAVSFDPPSPDQLLVLTVPQQAPKKRSTDEQREHEDRDLYASGFPGAPVTRPYGSPREQFVLADAEIPIMVVNSGDRAASTISGWIELDQSLLRPYEPVGTRALPRQTYSQHGWSYHKNFNHGEMEVEPTVHVWQAKLLPDRGTVWKLEADIVGTGEGKIHYNFTSEEGARAEGDLRISIRQSQ